MKSGATRMVGYVRLFLAYLVMISHLNLRILGFNPGVFAVVIFYILAGYVVTRLWDCILPKGPNRVGRFILDRCVRIFPLYFYACLLTIIFLLLSDYGNAHFTFDKLLKNALVIPLNYYMWIDSEILQYPAWCIVPPAWSLGVELQAYLGMLLLFIARPLKYFLAPLSVVVYLLASQGGINSELFTYRLLPGVFFTFVVGHCLSRIHMGEANWFDRFYPGLVWMLIGLFGWWWWRLGRLHVPYVGETLAGLLIGIPLVHLVHNIRLRLPGDNLCGSLSYGLFLCHFLIIWVLEYAGYGPPSDGAAGMGYVVSVSFGSLTLSWCGVRYIESPVECFRKKSGLQSMKSN